MKIRESANIYGKCQTLQKIPKIMEMPKITENAKNHRKGMKGMTKSIRFLFIKGGCFLEENRDLVDFQSDLS